MFTHHTLVLKTEDGVQQIFIKGVNQSLNFFPFTCYREQRQLLSISSGHDFPMPPCLCKCSTFSLAAFSSCLISKLLHILL